METASQAAGPGPVAVLLLIFLIPILVSVAIYRIERGSLSNLNATDTELISVKRWISANVSTDANFLLTFNHDAFSAYSNRNYWWGIKYGDGVICNPALFEEFFRRKRWQEKLAAKSFKENRASVREFAVQNGLTHVLVKGHFRESFPQFDAIYLSPSYTIFRVK